MTDEELNQWAYAIDAAIKGERLTYEYEFMESARHDFRLVRQILDAIDLPYVARFALNAMQISIDGGGIRFATKAPWAQDRWWQ